MLFLLFLLAAATPPDARLVCSADEQLVVVSPETGARKPVEPQPPAPAVALGTAGDTLVAASASGSIMQLRDGQWGEVTRIGGSGVQKRPLRIDSRYPQWATIWLRGDDPGTIPGAVGVSVKGEVRRYNSADARKMGGPRRSWSSTNRPPGAAGSSLSRSRARETCPRGPWCTWGRTGPCTGSRPKGTSSSSRAWSGTAPARCC